MTTTLRDDKPCRICGTQPEQRSCVCGLSARITDCGHMPQPRPIAAGRRDGTDMHHNYCDECA